MVDGRAIARIGRRSAEIDRLLAGLGARRAVLVTAANPRSRPMPPGWNARRLRVLAARVARWPTCPAEGRLGRWRETGLLVAADPAVVVRFGRIFRQNALVILARGRPASLLPLDWPRAGRGGPPGR